MRIRALWTFLPNELTRIEQIRLAVNPPIELFLPKGINVRSVFGPLGCLGRPDWDPGKVRS